MNYMASCSVNRGSARGMMAEKCTRTHLQQGWNFARYLLSDQIIRSRTEFSFATLGLLRYKKLHDL